MQRGSSRLNQCPASPVPTAGRWQNAGSGSASEGTKPLADRSGSGRAAAVRFAGSRSSDENADREAL